MREKSENTHILIERQLRIYQRERSAVWQCAFNVDGRWQRTSTNERELAKAKKTAHDILVKANVKKELNIAAQATRQAFTGFYGGLATVKAFEAAEKSSASALASSQLGFDVGTLINLDVLIALDALFTTRATLYKARYDTILNALRLKAHAAALTDQDLVAVNALLK